MPTPLATVNDLPGIEGHCPRCLSLLLRRAGGWRGLVDMSSLEDGDTSNTVHMCVMCGYYEDAVIRANRLAQHQATTQEVGA